MCVITSDSIIFVLYPQVGTPPGREYRILSELLKNKALPADLRLDD